MAIRSFNKPVIYPEPSIKIVNFNLFSNKPRSSSKGEKEAFRSLSMERLKLYNEIIDKSQSPKISALGFEGSSSKPSQKPIDYSMKQAIKLQKPHNEQDISKGKTYFEQVQQTQYGYNSNLGYPNQQREYGYGSNLAYPNKNAINSVTHKNEGTFVFNAKNEGTGKITFNNEGSYMKNERNGIVQHKNEGNSGFNKKNNEGTSGFNIKNEGNAKNIEGNNVFNSKNEGSYMKNERNCNVQQHKTEGTTVFNSKNEGSSMKNERNYAVQQKSEVKERTGKTESYIQKTDKNVKNQDYETKVLEIDLSTKPETLKNSQEICQRPRSLERGSHEKTLHRSNSFNKREKNNEIMMNQQEINYNTILSNMKNKAKKNNELKGFDGGNVEIKGVNYLVSPVNNHTKSVFKAKTSQTPTLRTSYIKNQEDVKYNNWFKVPSPAPNNESSKENIPPSSYDMSKSLQIDTLKPYKFSKYPLSPPNIPKQDPVKNDDIFKKTEKSSIHKENIPIKSKENDEFERTDFKEYKRLQEKLLFLENRIVEMKSSFETAQNSCIKDYKSKEDMQKTDLSIKPSKLANPAYILSNNQNTANKQNNEVGYPAQFSMNSPKGIQDIKKSMKKTDSQQKISQSTEFGKPPKGDSANVSLKAFVTQVEKGHFLPRELEKDEDRLKRLNKRTSLEKKHLEKKPNSFSCLQEASPEKLEKKYHSLGKKNVYYIATIVKAFLQRDSEELLLKISREHFLQTFQSILFSQGLKPIPQARIDEKKMILPKKEFYKNKKTLIFDLDETLIHCNENSSLKSDIILPIQFPNGQTIEAGINIRPYTLQCLKELANFYEIIVFTASHNCYANVVLNYLDPKNELIQHRLFREHCIQTEEGIFIKDLRVLDNRSLDDILIIDNAAYSFGFQLDNGVPILPYYDNKDDRELVNLTNYLKGVKDCKEIREANKKMFRFGEFSAFLDAEEALQNLYEDCI